MRGWLAQVARKPAIQAVGATTAASVTAALVGFGANILMTRALGPGSRGQVAFVLQAAYVLAPLIMLGVDRASLRRDSIRDDAPATRHLTPLALVAGVVLLGFYRDWRALAAAVVLATSWLAIYRSEALRDHSFARWSRRFLVYQAIIAVGTVLMYATGETRWHLWLMPYVVPSTLVVLFEVRRALIRPRRPLAAVTRTSLGLLPGSLAGIVVMRAERVLMPALASNAQLGLYVAVATATEPAYWIAQALADHRTGRTEGDRGLRRLLRRLARDMALFTFVAAALGVAVWLLVEPVFGREYVQSRSLVLPLVLAVTVLAGYRQVVAWHLAGPLPDDVSRIEIATAVLAVPCYAVGIHLWAALGAAWATLGVYSAGLAIALAVAVRRSGRSAR